MELNEYAVWKCRVQTMQRAYVQNGMDMDFAGNHKVMLELTVVAPRGTLGRALLDVHFNEEFKVREKLESGRRWEWIDEPKEEKLDAVVRFENAYRGRM